MIENFKKEIILASNSPRRKDFFNLFKFPFKIKTFDVEETYPSNLKEADIPRYIAGLKSNPFKKNQWNSYILIY